MQDRTTPTWLRFSALFFVLVASSLAPLSVFAEGYLKPLKSGYWEGGSVDNQGNGSADYCQLAAYNKQGFVILLIWMERGLLYAMTNPSWKLESGRHYEVELAVDGIWSDRQNIKATDTDTLAWLVGNDAKAIEALQKGARLKAKGEMGRYASKLTGTRKAIDALRDCYGTEVAAASSVLPVPTARVPKPAVPVVRPASDTPVAEPSAPDSREQSPEPISAASVPGSDGTESPPQRPGLSIDELREQGIAERYQSLSGQDPPPPELVGNWQAMDGDATTPLPREALLDAALGLALLGREDAHDAFVVFMTPEAEETFEPAIGKVGPGWRYLFSSAVPAVCYLSRAQALVLHYSPWADVGLVTVWRQAADGPEIQDAEILPGDFLRNGPQGTFDLVPYWLREGARIPPLAVADAMDSARVAFTDICLAAPPGAFRGLRGLTDPDALSAAHLAATLMLGQAGPIGLRAYLSEPEYVPINRAALGLLGDLKDDEVPQMSKEAEVSPASLLDELAAGEGPVPSFLAVVADEDLGFLFLRLPDDPFHFLSLALRVKDEVARLTHAQRLSYAATALERVVAEDGP